MYQVILKKSVEKKISKLDKDIQIMLIGWIKKNLINTESPRSHGKALKGSLGELWRYRIGNYRLVVQIQDNSIKIITIINVGHRKDIYR